MTGRTDAPGGEPDEPDRGALTPDVVGGSGGGLDFGALLGQAQEMMEAQAAAADTEVAGQSGGGVVKVIVTGSMEFRSVTIDPAAVDPDDVEMLQDLVLAAVRDAVDQVGRLQQGTVGGLDLGDLDLGDLDLGALGLDGLLGGGSDEPGS